jgi:hypothetical protein
VTLTSPDEWATSTGRDKHRRGAWVDDIPPEVVEYVRSSRQTVPVLVEWFHTVVAEAFPDDEWPKLATRSKVERLRLDLRQRA